MYRILIIDDEKIVLDSVQYIIENNYEDFEIETARNGKEGLIKLDSFKPHIVMTDIRMPGISGLEFIKKARKLDTQVKILIVTAFEQFEYAKESFKFKVEDYILKPLSKKKLLESLNKTIRSIEQEKARRDEELESIEKYYSSIGLVENNFFNSIILKRDFSRFMNQYRDLLSIDLMNGCIVAIKFTYIPEEGSWNQMNEFNVKLNDCNEYLKSHIKYNFEALVSNLFVNKIFVYIESDGLEDTSQLEFWKNVHDTLLKKFGLKTKIGIGTSKGIANVYDSYEEALTVLKLSDRNEDYYHDAFTGSIDLHVFGEVCDQIVVCFKERNKKIFDVLVDLKHMYLSNLDETDTFVAAEHNLLEILVQLHLLMKDSKVYTSEILEEKKYITEFLGKTAIDKLNYFEDKLHQLFDDYVHAQEYDYSEITTTVMKIINSSYKGELSLEETAHKVNVTPQYLSKLFKEDTGKSFKESIIELRINEAKKLLKTSTFNIREIAYEVGYNDPNYFIRIFKKNTGLTPKEYQRVVE